MTQDEINRRSRLMAEFDGRPKFRASSFIYGNAMGSGLPSYHTSWDELHRVWEKFRMLPVLDMDDTSLTYEYHKWRCTIENKMLYFSTLDAFTALSDAIEWLNSIKEK